jgi:hypothetical protein
MGFFFQFCDIKKLDEFLAKFVEISLKKNPKFSQFFWLKKTKFVPPKKSMVCKRKSPKALSKGLTHGGKRDKISLQINCKSPSPFSRSFQCEFEEANHVMKEFAMWWSLPNVQGVMILLCPL